jgi:hypothetical protein
MMHTGSSHLRASQILRNYKSSFAQSRAATTAKISRKPLNDAKLETVEMLKLVRREPEELQKLLRACQNDGFFYVKLLDFDNGRLLNDWRNIVHLMQPWFRRPLAEKMKYQHGTVLNG